jgi:glycosyltransferase involved in cell wall biosynthesis
MSAAIAHAAPSVSILIPALRPNWLDVAIASALAQTHTDFELLISDDSPDTHIEAVVSKWDDPRIRYMRNPDRGAPGANRDHLLGQARGEYLKFLFDDDFLLPRSVEVLLHACRVTGARLAFHARHLVDENGRPLASPQPVKPGAIVALDQTTFFTQLIAECANPIGEPTNVLLHAATLRSMDAPFGLDGRRMRFLTDVALYTNFATGGHGIAGVGYFGSAFRQHASQASGSRGPGHSAGYFEWDLLRRWSVDGGLLAGDIYAKTATKLIGLYRQMEPNYPELGPLRALAEQGLADGAPALDPNFLEALSLAYTTIEMRKLATLH